MDKVGDMEWCQVTAVTRHLPVGDLIKVKVASVSLDDRKINFILAD